MLNLDQKETKKQKRTIHSTKEQQSNKSEIGGGGYVSSNTAGAFVVGSPPTSSCTYHTGCIQHILQIGVKPSKNNIIQHPSRRGTPHTAQTRHPRTKATPPPPPTKQKTTHTAVVNTTRRQTKNNKGGTYGLDRGR